MSVTIRQHLNDFRFWIILFFLIRLIGITNAPLEISHNWRQSTVNMIARNYYEGNTTFFYPMMDNAGEKSGITGTELPILNSMISQVALVFGWQHWYGRIINLIITSLGIGYFFLWLKEFIDERVALPAIIILLASLWFAFSRKIMPDTFSIGVSFIGLYYGYKHLYSKKLIHLLLFILLGSLGVLCKVPAILSLSPLLVEYLIIFRRDNRYNFPLLAGGFIVLSFTLFWYSHWFNYLIELGQWQFYYMGPGFPKGLIELISMPNETLDNIYFESLKFSGFAAFISGVFLLFIKKSGSLKYIFLLWTFGFILFMIQAGSGYSTHDYYTIPFVPMMAIVAGYAISKIPKQSFRIVALLIISIEGIANQQHDFIIKDSQLYKLELEPLSKKYIPENNLIIINTDQNPQSLYFTNRKGWSLGHDEILKSGNLDSLINLGAQFLIIDKHFGEIEINYPIVSKDENYVIYSLKENYKQ